jgi:hypothetical protein
MVAWALAGVEEARHLTPLPGYLKKRLVLKKERNMPES